MTLPWWLIVLLVFAAIYLADVAIDRFGRWWVRHECDRIDLEKGENLVD